MSVHCQVARNCAAFALGLLAVTNVAESSPPIPPTLTAEDVSLDQTEEFLSIQAEGAMTNTRRIYSLRGDGLLTVFTSANASATPTLVYEEQLSDDDLSSTVDAIFRGELLSFDREKVLGKHAKEPSPGAGVEDAGSIEVRLRLPLRAGAGPTGVDVLTHSFGVNLSDMVEAHFPSIAEYAALREIFGRFRQADRRAWLAAKKAAEVAQ